MKKIIVGSDIGNSKTEITLERNGQELSLRQPSVVSEITGKYSASDQTLKQIMADLYNHLTVHISSNALSRKGQYYIGSRALKAPNKSNMEITLGGKHNNDIPVIMTLGMIAANEVESYFESEGQLPEDHLSLSVDLVTAIPSSEFKKETATALEQRFTNNNNKHIVVLYIGDTDVHVSIKITNCKVTEEGKTSMIAFNSSDDDILVEYNKLYNQNKTVKDFKNVSSLHIDIGDGTTEMTLIKGLQPIPNMSRGIQNGVGYASDEAIEIMKEKLDIGTDFTRQDLQEWLKKDSAKGKFAREAMARGQHIQADKILAKVKSNFKQMASSEADYIFVHGGGSITFKENLYENLVEYANNNFSEVVWVPEKYATSMNSRGTFLLAKIMFGK